jgi:hypothetical protein
LATGRKPKATMATLVFLPPYPMGLVAAMMRAHEG